MSEASSHSAQNSSSQTFLTALVINAAILGLELVAFVILKHKLTRIYAPRTYLPPPEYVFLCETNIVWTVVHDCACLPRKRAAGLPGGPWKWLFAIIAIPTSDVVRFIFPVYSFHSSRLIHHLSFAMHHSYTRMDWTPTCSYASSGCSSSSLPLSHYSLGSLFYLSML